MTKIINLFGGPGTGKSTTASSLFSKFKRSGINVELVNEYAKDMTWEGRNNILTDQLYILAKQNRRVRRLVGHVDYVISDSPIIMGLAYAPENYYPAYASLIKEVWDSFDNINYFLDRGDIPFDPIGRNQNLEQSRELDGKILDILKSLNIDHMNVSSTEADSLIFENEMRNIKNGYR